LYRHSLKLLDSWCANRRIFCEEATELRARFDANRQASPAAVERLLREANEEMFTFTHPDPYVKAYLPGGTLFMRNPPPPIEVCFPDGNYPDDAPHYTVNPDMTFSTPETGKSAVGSVLVDFTKKNME
jgi:NADH dehydrogenase (ubiquinone) 1 beta subcomplex subunit 9